VSAATAAPIPGDSAAGGGAFELQRRAPGRFAARGVLTFASARGAWEEGLAALQEDPSKSIEVECAGVTHADSAGLMVLLDWLGAARRRGRSITYRYLPNSLRSLAAISDLEKLLA